MSKFPYNTSRWRKLRHAKLLHAPTCEHCAAMGRVVMGKVVDHVKAIRNGGLPFPSLDGLQTLCQTCHNRKTQSDLSDTQHVVQGYDLEGNPIDQTHEWHNGGASNHEEQGGYKPMPPTNVYLVSENDNEDGGDLWV